MIVTEDEIRVIMSRFFTRCDLARQLGGIPLWKIIDRQATIPDGWTFDDITQHYVPRPLDSTLN